VSGPQERHAIRDLTVAVGGAGAETSLVDGVSFDIHRGQILGLVGETGAGKTLTTRALLGLLPPGLRVRGTLALDGRQPLSLADVGAVRAELGRVLSCVLQNPYSMLDPLQRVDRQLREGVVHNRLASRSAADARARELLAAMGFSDPDSILPLYPHQLSGGMAQRVATAIAMMPKPELLALDEPTSALDAHVRLEVLGLLRARAQQERTAVLLVSHDLGLVGHFCDEVVVAYAGTVVERGPTARVVGHPHHPYTAALLNCSATFDAVPRAPMRTVGGTPPAPSRRPSGCPYAPRCPLAVELCTRERPALRRVSNETLAACHRAEDMASGGHAQIAAGNSPADPSRPLSSRTGEPAAVRVVDAAVDYRRRRERFRALDGVTFELRAGQTLAVVGESGAGKSTLVKLVAGLEQPAAGTVEVNGSPPRLRAGTVSPVQVVFQNPIEALNPYASVGRSIAEPLRDLSREQRRQRVAELLDDVGLEPARAGSRPSAFSGGQLQRVVLARALAADPAVLICDEATSALDVSVQAQIANLIMKLQGTKGFACLLVTHDLGLAHVLADSVLVLRNGEPVELAPASRFFAGPRTTYARSLLAATRDHQLRDPEGSASGPTPE
jgi:peptide/nickel transport system ATP-binding protein